MRNVYELTQKFMDELSNTVLYTEAQKYTGQQDVYDKVNINRGLQRDVVYLADQQRPSI